MQSADEPFVAVVDCEMGNPGSCYNMLRKLGAKAILTADPDAIARASRIVLPGVGSFDEGMRNLRRLHLIDPLGEAVLNRKVPLLGICLGMQLLGLGSEEGKESGLGWLAFRCHHFRSLVDRASALKVPHMGWDTIAPRREHALLAGWAESSRFYFVHSYFCPAEIGEISLAVTRYGGAFSSIVAHENILGVQFHPEKSHHFGLRLLDAFVQVAA
jgi:glutamine amidotransferase